MSPTERLEALKKSIAELDRLRAQAEATVELSRRREAEINDQIRALGVDPKDAEEVVVKLEQGLSAELAALDAALATERQGYLVILQAADVGNDPDRKGR